MPTSAAERSQTSYSLAIAPAVGGILLGAVVTTALPGHSPDSVAYRQIAEFQLWRVIIVAQLAVYIAIACYFAVVRSETQLPNLSRRDAVGTASLTILVVLLPNLLVRPGGFPLQWQRIRLLIVVGVALVAVLLVMLRVARVYVAFRRNNDLETHTALRRMARDLLMVAGLIVTLATLGSGVLQSSLAALPGFENAITPAHVLAYGAYFTTVLFLFFTPLLVAERHAALEVAARKPLSSDDERHLGLHLSLTEQLASTFGVLSPLLGALATRLLS